MAAMLVEFLLPGTCAPDRDPPLLNLGFRDGKKKRFIFPPLLLCPSGGGWISGGGGGGLVTGGGGYIRKEDVLEPLVTTRGRQNDRFGDKMYSN